MSERKLTRGLDDIAPNNSEKAARSRTINPNSEEVEVRKERKKLEPVVKGVTVKQKPSIFTKFKESFLGEGANVGEFVVYDILVPALRNTISDMGFGLIEMFFGTSRDRGRSSRVIRDRGRSYIDYRGASSGRDRGRDRDRDDYRDIDRRDRARHEFGNVLFDSRGEAEDVLARLVDLIQEYGEATVAAFYELSRIESTHADSNYGWTNLRDAYTDRVRNGYIIVFPQTRPL
jgi:hypothetical protein